MPKKQLTGVVVSDKMDKTVVVKVERIKVHPKFKVRHRVHKKYKAHDEKNEYKVGDVVIIEECKPISKDKRWRIVKKISQNSGEAKPETNRE
jgi:small subunit ribosomal protein S17